MFIVILRVIVILIVVLFFIRMMGKRQIGEMQPIELVMTYIIAEVACVPMSDPGIPLSYGAVPIVTLFLVHFLLSFLSRKSLWFRSALDGKSVMVIDESGINYTALKRLNMNMNDLIEAIRNEGHFDIAEIKYALFETNGKLCVIPKADNLSVTVSDLKITKPQPSFPVSFIIDGKVINLDLIGVPREHVESILRSKGFKTSKQIILATTDSNGNVFIQPRYGKPVTATIKDLRLTA